MSEIEICCTAADRQRVDWLAHALAERGWSCRFTVDRLPQAEARCAVVVWTHEGRRSSTLKRAARAARRRGILICATLDDVRPPSGLSGRAKADLSAWPARAADRAIDDLLDDVAFVVANPKVVRERSDLGDRVVVAVVALLFAGLLYTVVSRERGEGQAASDDADTAPTALPAIVAPSVAAGTTPEDIPAPVRPPAASAETTTPHEQAATLGREAIAALGRVLAGDATSAEEAKRSAYAALRLDPREPNAQLAYAICTALLDGAWADAARTIHEVDPTLLSRDAAELAARWYLVHGDVQQAGTLLTQDGAGDRTWEIVDIAARLTPPVDSHESPPFCALLDGTDQAATADAYRALSPGARLALLGEPCFITHVAESPTTRTLLGIGL